MAIKLGSKVRDTISGFTGIATGRSEFLHGCARVTIEPQELKDGKTIDAQWFDEQRLEVLEVLPVFVSPESSATSGGPQGAPPPSRSDATR